LKDRGFIGGNDIWLVDCYRDLRKCT